MLSLYAPTKKEFGLLFFGSFFARAIVLVLFLFQHEHYKQPDSVDYHNGAMCIAMGNGMHRPDTQQPIFWRTPGYPAYLAFFYNWFGLKGGQFSANSAAQKASLWVQLMLASCIPLVIFVLAHTLIGSFALARLAAWINAFHIGFVLNSGYLLTEGISVLFFYLFLLFFYTLVIHTPRRWIAHTLAAVTTLSIYTWMRPMGEFVAVLSTIILALCARGTWKLNIQKAGLFALLFFASLFPWYWRNHNLTDNWFFCPMSGIYLNTFSVPKIMRHVDGTPIERGLKEAQQRAQQELRAEYMQLRKSGHNKHVSPLVNKRAAMPIVMAHPFIFAYEWVKEVIKTTFDLYSSQFTVFANSSFWYDPIEEFLLQKTTDCLWTQPIPWYARALCWLELVFAIWLWLGLFGGLWCFVLQPLWRTSSDYVRHMHYVWFVTGLMIGAVVCMTGGFGYARLRLPVEGLMIVLSLSFYWWYKKEQ